MSIESLEEALRLADEPAQPKQAPQTPNAERAREIADALDRVMAEPREVMRPLTCAAAPPPQHDEAVAMRPARQVRNARIPVTILVAVIIAVVMMWPITNLFRSYVEHPTPTIPAFDPDRGSSEAPQAAQSAPPPTASPTEPAETAPNAPAVGSGEAAAVTDSVQSAATAETASSEAVTPEPIIPQRDRMAAAPTATGPATGSMAPVGPVPLPRARPVDAPVDTTVLGSPSSVSPLLANPAAYGGPAGLESAH